MQGIKISVNYTGARGDIVLLTIVGYVDTTTCQEVGELLKKLVIEGNFNIICDLRHVNYISSAGWGVFVGEIKNIRDKGGDLKVAQMSQEVLEVFEMLEFNRIIMYYDTLEEAIDEFDIIRGIDVTKSHSMQRKSAPQTVKTLNYIDKAKVKEKSSESLKDTFQKPSEKDLPMVEKIKRIVVENPFYTINEMRKQLKSERFGKVKIGYFKLRSMLKQLSLENKEKRYRFYRSR